MRAEAVVARTAFAVDPEPAAMPPGMRQPRLVRARGTRHLAVLLGVIAGLAPNAAWSDTTPEDSQPIQAPPAPLAPKPRPITLPSDWPSSQELLGLPDWLALGLAFSAEPMANLLGGSEAGASWIGQTSLTVSIGSGLARDLGSWGELDHWSVNTTLTHTHGDGLYGQRIGAELAPQQLAYPNGLLLSEASLSRKGGSGWLDLKGGLVPINPDFVAAPVLDFYGHSALNNTLNLSLNGVPISPYAALGGIVQVRPAPELSLRYGWFDLSSTKPLSTWLGSPPPFNNAPDGAVQILQLNWTPAALAPTPQTPLLACQTARGLVRHRSGCRQPVTVQNQLPGGLLSLGGYSATIPATGAYGSVTLRSGLPLGLDERLWLGGAWGSITPDRLAPDFVAGGLVVQGVLPGRPLDVLVFGAGRAGLNASAGLRWPSAYEGMVELGYRWRLNGALALQPTLQWIIHPSGGEQPLPDILTTSLQISLSF
jgi:porin